MRFYVLASGSKGNATIITNGKTNILIDQGLTKKWLIEGLSETPVTLEAIDFALFTHEHGDHAAGHQFIPQEKRYATSGTLDVMPEHILTHYRTIQLGTFSVTPLPTSHDAHDGIGFIIKDEEETLVYMTDTGYISEANMAYMKDADYYILESNHNVRMLLQTNRGYELIQRILGDSGHLSNEDAALYLTQLVGPKTKEIILAHLSEEANNPDVALKTHLNIYRRKYIEVERLRIVPAKQYGVISGGR